MFFIAIAKLKPSANAYSASYCEFLCAKLIDL